VIVTTSGAEAELASGGLDCPGCGGRLRRWGWARARLVRGLSGVIAVRPPRARCRSCSATHVLLPAVCVPRRADSAEVIGHALLAAAEGHSATVIATRLGPAGQHRSWLDKGPPATRPSSCGELPLPTPTPWTR
jgi:hypothetical protein